MVKPVKHAPGGFDTFVCAMWILFPLQSSKPEPDIDGMYNLRAINDAPEKTWTKSTPYSPAVKW
jgi:hypothetical protein